MLMPPGQRNAPVTTRADGVSVTWSAPSSAMLRARRRDRRDRGIRGPLAPRAVPLARSRAGRFDEQVLAVWDRLVAVRPELQFIEIAVSDVPEPDHPSLSVLDPADAGLPARVTIYRWALELRCSSDVQLTRLLTDVLTEQAALFLGTSPHALDGAYPRV